MYKKFLFIFLFMIILLLPFYGNSMEKSDYNFFKFDDKNLLNNYSSQNSNSIDLAKVDSTLKYTHAVFAGITYAGLWAMDAIGVPLLYYAFTNPDNQYYPYLKFAHIGIAASTLLTFATVVTLAFTKLGIKLKNGFAIRKTHLTAAIVTLSFYALELTSIILTAVFFANNFENAKWVGLAHGITCASTTIAFSVSFITVFF